MYSTGARADGLPYWKLGRAWETETSSQIGRESAASEHLVAAGPKNTIARGDAPGEVDGWQSGMELASTTRAASVLHSRDRLVLRVVDSHQM